MSATNAHETALLALLYNNTNIANIGDATGLRGSTAAGSLFVSLHTSDPGEAAASQAASETAYTNYARVAVARSAAGWTITGNSVANAAIVSFPAGGATGSTVTHFGVGTGATGATDLLFKGVLGSSLAVSSGITPSFAAGALSNVCD